MFLSLGNDVMTEWIGGLLGSCSVADVLMGMSVSQRASGSL